MCVTTIRYDEMERVLLGKIDGLEGENTALTEKQEELQIESGRLQSTTHQLQSTTEQLQSEVDSVKRQLHEKEESIVAIRSELEVAETSRIKLLGRFMSEMDRMRDEIKKLNAMTRRSRQQ